jgi:hypothetical protein
LETFHTIFLDGYLNVVVNNDDYALCQ